MPQDAKNEAKPGPANKAKPDRNQAGQESKPEGTDKSKPESERTGPGAGAGRGNDLPSNSGTQRDTRSAEGTQGGEESGRAMQSENPDA